MKKFTVLIITLLLAICCGVTAYAAEDRQRVFDKAGLFSLDEKDALEKKLNETVDETGLDFVILTTNDKEGAGLRDYADDFYDNGGFGTDDEGSGLLMLIDMEDRTVYISTMGQAIKYLTDQRILALTDYNDELYDYLADGAYADAAKECINGVENFVEQGIPDDQNTYYEETGERVYNEAQRRLTFLEILLSLGIPALVAYMYIRNIKRQYAMVAEKQNVRQYILAYRAVSNFAFAVNTDELLHHNVTCRHIPREHNSGSSGSWGSSSGQSTVHTSSSGHTHGGGGGGRHF